MKKIVRLTESDLHRIVKESVKRIMEEYYPVNSNNFAKDYRFGAEGYVKGSANMPNPKYDDVSPYSKHTDYYAAPHRDSDQMYKDDAEFNKREHNKQTAADKRWMNAADSRPLHRKGSLNRAMEESTNKRIDRIVSECIKRNFR